MKISRPTQLMDMTNVLRQYINRKKPIKRLQSKSKGSTVALGLDLQENKINSSNFRSSKTLNSKLDESKQKLAHKQTPNQDYKLQNKLKKVQINQTVGLKSDIENKLNKNLNLQRIGKQESQPKGKQFRILKTRSKLLNPHYSLMTKKHQTSINQSKFQSKLIRHRYWIQHIIRQSMSSTLYMCKDTLKQSQIVIKVIRSFEQNSQLKYLKYLEHPNLIKYENYFIDQQKLHFTMPAYQMNLLKYISNNQCQISNKQIIKHIFRQICNGINHLHSSDYAHTNLKLEHILINVSEKPKIAIIDFSLLQKCKDNQKLIRKQVVRNPNYACPQLVSNRVYNAKSADCWALGIILYGLITGRLPFRSRQQSQLERKIKKGKLCFPQNVSEDERQLIKNILNVNQSQRYTIKNILDSKWFN